MSSDTSRGLSRALEGALSLAVMVDGECLAQKKGRRGVEREREKKVDNGRRPGDDVRQATCEAAKKRKGIWSLEQRLWVGKRKENKDGRQQKKSGSCLHG